MTISPTNNRPRGRKPFSRSSLGNALRRLIRPTSPDGGLHTHDWAPFGDAGLSRRCTQCGDLMFPGLTSAHNPDSR